MRRSCVVGQCRHAARCWPVRPRHSVSPIALASSCTPRSLLYPSSRSFQISSSLRSKPKGSLGQLSGIDPKSLHDPSEASRKLFSEFAFAFDIDGVLYQGRNRVEGAEKVIKMIRSNGIRYVFLTNGGGVSENKKAQTLQQRLKIPEHEDVIRDRMILSHTPMSAWSDSLKNEGTIFITGSHPEQARQLALDYGFKRVVTPGDILAACPDVYPFELGKSGLHDKHVPLPDGKRIFLGDPYTEKLPEDALKIDQIFIWNDPRDWSVDIQMVYDLLVSHQGYMGTISHKNGDKSLPNDGWQQDGQPGIWISNMDLLWKTNYPVNRFGTGAFMAALEGVWSTATHGKQLQYEALGKPSRHTYKYAHERLLRYYHDMACARGDEPAHDTATCHPLKRVYMIGDNPESDIRGANDFEADDGTQWIPILVRTGVWRQTAAQREPRHRPAVIVDDVVDAVVWALNNEGLKASREWLLSALAHTKGYIKLPELQLKSGETGGVHPSEREAGEARL